MNDPAPPPDRRITQTGLVTITGQSGTGEYVPREAFERLLTEKDHLNKAMALLNAHLRIGIGLDVDFFLDRHGYTTDDARAMAGLVDEMRNVSTP